MNDIDKIHKNPSFVMSDDNQEGTLVVMGTIQTDVFSESRR